MPIFFQQDIDADTRLGIWKIEEDEAFFLSEVMPQRNVSHPHKKLQHLAGRYLLKHLFPRFPLALIRIADTRKPFLEDEAYHFSISHCGDYAAAIVSQKRRVGVDIEIVTDKVARIKHKFLSEEEMSVGNTRWTTGKELASIFHPQLTLLWSCKEAVFKWYGSGEVDFKKHIVVEKQEQTDEWAYQTSVCFQKEEALGLTLYSYFFGSTANELLPAHNPSLVLSYVVT